MEVGPLSRGMMLQSLSVPITGSAFAFSIAPCPHFYRRPLRFAFRLPGESMGLPRFALSTVQVRFRLSADSVLSMYSPTSKGIAHCNTFWFRLISNFSLLSLTAFTSDSHYINHAAQAWLPSRIVACSLLPSSHDSGFSPTGRGYVVTPASSQPLPSASVVLGYRQWNDGSGRCQTVELCDLVSHNVV